MKTLEQIVRDGIHTLIVDGKRDEAIAWLNGFRLATARFADRPSLGECIEIIDTIRQEVLTEATRCPHGEDPAECE